MKVRTESTKKEFKPITVTIILESKEELNRLHELVKPREQRPVPKFGSAGMQDCIAKDNKRRAEHTEMFENLFDALGDLVEE